MSARLCPRGCGLECRSESALQAHLNRKHPCNQGEHACQHCPQRFEAKWRRDEHQKGCTGCDSVTSVAAECVELRAVVSTAAALSAKGALRSLGEELVAHIGATQLEQIGQSRELGRGSSVVHFFMLLHCSPDATENHNMFLPGDGSKLAVFSGGRWRHGATRDWIWLALSKAAMLFQDLLQDSEYKWGFLMHSLQPLLTSRDALLSGMVAEATATLLAFTSTVQAPAASVAPAAAPSGIDRRLAEASAHRQQLERRLAQERGRDAAMP